MANSPNRIVFGAGVRGGHDILPELLEVGWGRFDTADFGHLRPHQHEGAFEFCFIVSGEVDWETRNSSYVLRAGDVYITKPDEPHWGKDSAMHPCTLYWIILGAPSAGFEWPDLDPETTRYLEDALDRLNTHKLRGTAKILTLFDGIFNEHVASSDGVQLPLFVKRATLRATLHRLLVELSKCSGNPSHARPMDQNALPVNVLNAIRFLDENATGAGAVRQVCEATGQDYNTLNRLFIEHVGLSIGQYWLRERIRISRERLEKTDESITAVGAELGFSSSQHFATAFRKITGLRPSEYRAKCKGMGATATIAESR